MNKNQYIFLASVSMDDIQNYILRSQIKHFENRYVLVRCNKMNDVEGLFNEFSSALQFPYYFGENWGAFDECMNDLSWVPCKNLVIILSNFENFMKNCDTGYVVELLEILHESIYSWEIGVSPFSHLRGELRKLSIILHMDRTLPFIDEILMRCGFIQKNGFPSE